MYCVVLCLDQVCIVAMLTFVLFPAHLVVIDRYILANVPYPACLICEVYIATLNILITSFNLILENKTSIEVNFRATIGLGYEI